MRVRALRRLKQRLKQNQSPGCWPSCVGVSPLLTQTPALPASTPHCQPYACSALLQLHSLSWSHLLPPRPHWLPQRGPI